MEKNDERKLYEQAWNEIEKKTYDIGLWAKAFTDSNGDEKQTRALYLKDRVRDLESNINKKQAKAGQARTDIKEKKLTY